MRLGLGPVLWIVLSCSTQPSPAPRTVDLPAEPGETSDTPPLPSRGGTDADPPWQSAPPASSENAARAEALFVQARTLMSQSRHSEACPLYFESMNLDPALGTLLNLANCSEVSGDKARACRLFSMAATWANEKHQAERARFAESRAKSLGCP